MLINAHRLGSAYGRRPSEILNGSGADYDLDLEAHRIGSEQDRRDAEKASRSRR